MDEMLDETPEDQRRSVEKEFWDEHQKRCGLGSQYKPLLKPLVQTVRAVAEKENLDRWDYEQKLCEADEVLEDVTDALRAFWKAPPDNKFWYGFHDSQLIENPEEWTGASPIDSSRLYMATARYLERPWMQVNLLDWYILNGFVLDELLRLADGIKSGSSIGSINWAYILSGGKYLKTLWWKFVLGAAKFALSWLLLPALAALAYYLGYKTVANWTLGLFGLVVVIRVILLPARYVGRRARKRQMGELSDKLKRLIQIYQSCNASTLNPKLLRERILEAERTEALIKPAVYAILDRAITRDPAVFTTGG
jgi:hypothetical protein